MKRIDDSIDLRQEEWQSARHHSVWNPKFPFPDVVKSAIQRCIQQGAHDSKDWLLVHQLYRAAGLESEARTLADKRLGQIPPDSTRVRAELLYSLVLSYFERPLSLSLAQPFIDRFFEVDSVLPIGPHITMFRAIMQAIDWENDRERRQQYAEKTLQFDRVALKGNLPEPVRRGLVFLAFDAIKWKYKDSLDATLRISAKEYTNMLFRVGRRDSTLTDEELKGLVLVQQLEQVPAKYWFPVSAKAEGYPRKGKVTLIVNVEMVGQGLAMFHAAANFARVAHVRRLKEKFPEIDIVLWGKTKGYFGPLEPQSPEHEAGMMDSIWRKVYKLPAVLAVSETEFWHLPDLDRRRINEDNEFEKNWFQGNKYALIDQEGYQVVLPFVGPDGEYLWEKNIEEKVQILLSRSSGQ